MMTAVSYVKTTRQWQARRRSVPVTWSADHIGDLELKSQQYGAHQSPLVSLSETSPCMTAARRCPLAQHALTVAVAYLRPIGRFTRF
jgi:hypothetical protein